MPERETIPVVLFAYDRPAHLRRVLDALRTNRIPCLYTFSDGPRGAAQAERVAEVRRTLRAVDWCECVHVARERNQGLGTSILSGVASVLDRHDAAIVFEDDLLCAPGTYAWLNAALNRYRDEPRVLSVSAWTHARVTPGGLENQPFFSGRCNTLAWGAWRRTWTGMDRDAREMIRECRSLGIDPYRYGADLPVYAEEERHRNIWAVRLIYNHLRRGALCLCPARSMIQHIGYDSLATNANRDEGWADPPPAPAPPPPAVWPDPREHPESPALWQRACGARPGAVRYWAGRIRRTVARIARRAATRPSPMGAGV
ncbi:MAG: hypothetical protein HY568_01150 [Candidatus Latescibacteria bacterium]|nr:hypothetical protein [Candidatus Latescibacterota bacterium]